MPTGEFEPTPHFDDISPIRRFYSDITYKAELDMYVDVLIAADKLHEAVRPGDKSDELLQYIDIIGLSSKDDDEFQDRLAALPLTYFGDYIDVAYTPEDAGAWFKSALGHIKTISKERHSSDCLTGSGECQNPASCPFHVAACYLQRDLFEPRFDDVLLYYDPREGRSRILTKADLLRSYSLVEPEYLNARINSYNRRFNGLFG